jgi:hypothetical protein
LFSSLWLSIDPDSAPLTALQKTFSDIEHSTSSHDRVIEGPISLATSMIAQYLIEFGVLEAEFAAVSISELAVFPMPPFLI